MFPNIVWHILASDPDPGPLSSTLRHGIKEWLGMPRTHGVHTTRAYSRTRSVQLLRSPPRAGMDVSWMHARATHVLEVTMGTPTTLASVVGQSTQPVQAFHEKRETRPLTTRQSGCVGRKWKVLSRRQTRPSSR